MSVYPGHYNYAVEFEMILASGVLNGLTLKDRLHFVSEKDAYNWIKDVKRFDKGKRYINFKVKSVNVA